MNKHQKFSQWCGTIVVAAVAASVVSLTFAGTVAMVRWILS